MFTRFLHLFLHSFIYSYIHTGFHMHFDRIACRFPDCVLRGPGYTAYQGCHIDNDPGGGHGHGAGALRQDHPARLHRPPAHAPTLHGCHRRRLHDAPAHSQLRGDRRICRGHRPGGRVLRGSAARTDHHLGGGRERGPGMGVRVRHRSIHLHTWTTSGRCDQLENVPITPLYTSMMNYS